MALDRRDHLRPVQCQEFWRLRCAVSSLVEMSLYAPNHDLSKGPLHGRQFPRPRLVSVGPVELRNFSVRKLQPTVAGRTASDVVEIAIIERQVLEVFHLWRIRETPDLRNVLALLQRLDFAIPGHESLAVHRHLHDAGHGDFALACRSDTSHRFAHLQLSEVGAAQGDGRPEKRKRVGNRGGDYQGTEYRRYLKHETLRDHRAVAIRVPPHLGYGSTFVRR